MTYKRILMKTKINITHLGIFAASPKSATTAVRSLVVSFFLIKTF